MVKWRVGMLGVYLVVALGLAAGVEAQQGGVDLGKKYPATLDHDPNGKAYEWACEAGDVWRLKSFKFEMKDSFTVETGAARAVLGHNGTNVLWAVVLPEAPGRLTRQGGAGAEDVISIWLRLHPARVGELFPAATVEGGERGGRDVQDALAMARRLAGHKMVSSWQSGGLPMVPDRGSVTVDMETRGGPRRFFAVDTERGSSQYVTAFEGRILGERRPLTEAEARKAFDEVWQAFDREYAMFAIKPQVNWAALRERYAPRAALARNTYNLAAVIAEMLTKLEDLHVHVRVGNDGLPGFNRPRPLNGNYAATQKLIGTLNQPGQDLVWGRTNDGLGYINITGLNNPQLPGLFDDALEKLADTRGLILDLRYNGGGSEPLGQQITGRLIDKRAVYSMSQYRSGPRHEDLTGKMARAVGPHGPWRYDSPVVALQGRKTMSSAESFALMLAQCPQVTTMGDNTAGSSGNPRQVTVAGEITVTLPRWIDLDPAGKPIDVVGYPPKVRVEAKEADFRAGRDPVLEAALAHLRKVAPAKAPKRNVVPAYDPKLMLEAALSPFWQVAPRKAPKPEVVQVKKPKVIKMEPAGGATDVDPATRELRVTFDVPMGGGRSWVQMDPAHFPEIRQGERVRWSEDRRTCILPVRLKPDWSYAIMLNDPPYMNFTSETGEAAEPTPYEFKTRK